MQIFFAIHEKGNENAEEVADGMHEASETRQKYVNENCVETVLQFCENELKIDDARTKVKVEKAYRIGKRTDGATKARRDQSFPTSATYQIGIVCEVFLIV